jgi:hypothetical protein
VLASGARPTDGATVLADALQEADRDRVVGLRPFEEGGAVRLMVANDKVDAAGWYGW